MPTDRLDSIPPRLRDGEGGFEIRLARDLAAVGVRAYTLEDLANGPRTIPPAIPVFIDWLEHLEQKIPGPETRHKAAIRSGLIRNLADPAARNNPDAIDVLFSQLSLQPAIPGYVQLWVTNALSIIAGPAEFDRMASLLGTLVADEPKLGVVLYLAKFKTDAAYELLLTQLPTTATRIEAIKALGRFKRPEAGEHIRVYADHPDRQVRTAVTSALKKLGAAQ